MSALRRVKVGEHGPYVVLLEDRDGAGSESTGSHFAGGGEKITGWQAAEKWRARRGCGKEAEWKSQKSDFPTPLGNPANPAGFPRIIKGRPFEVGFECDAKLYRKEHPYGH